MPRPRVGLTAPPARRSSLLASRRLGIAVQDSIGRAQLREGHPWRKPVRLADLLASGPTKGETGLVWHPWSPPTPISDPRDHSCLWSICRPSLPITGGDTSQGPNTESRPRCPGSGECRGHERQDGASGSHADCWAEQKSEQAG